MPGETAKAIEDLRRELRAELRAIKDSLQDVKTLKEDIQDLKTLKDDIHNLLQENKDLKADNARLSRRIEELEQYQRGNNLEIKGVPLDGEPVTIIKKIGALVDEEITDADIDACHRVPTARHDETNIIVRFVRRTKRNAVLQKARKIRINTTKLGFEESEPVFVNEHLTRHGKQLLGAATKKKREVGWKFVWTNGGKIFARRDEQSATLRINATSDLEKMSRETE